MHNGEDMMRRGFGVGLSVFCGLVISLSIPFATYGADWVKPQLELYGSPPIYNGDTVALEGVGFEPGGTVNGFGVLVQVQNETPVCYRGFNLPDVEVQVNGNGGFRTEVSLDMLVGIRGHVQLAVYYQGTVCLTDFLPVSDPGIYQPPNLDATAGTLIFDTFVRGGPGEDPVVNGDDVPLSSNGQGDWVGDLFLINLERYTSNDGTGTSSPYNNLVNDVSFSSGNLTAGSSAIVASLTPTYKSIRMTVLVWDAGNYESITGTTTTGSAQEVGWLSTADITPPSASSANATSLTSIVVTFSEAVTTPSLNAEAIDNWTVTFSGGKAVSALSPLGSSGTTTITLTVADLGDRGATPTVQFTAGANEFEDPSGNDCQSTTSPHITATDGIAPATPMLVSPTSDTFLEGTSLTWSANQGGGTDNSFQGIKFQGSNNGATWDSLGVDTSSPFGGSYTFGTEYSYYRAQAYDDNNNTANSTSTANLQDAHHLHLTTIPAATQVNVESGQWTVSVHDNYGDLEIVTQTVGLSSTSSGGRFRESSGGPTVGSIDLSNASSGNFYYIDSQAGTPNIKVSNVTLVDDSTDYNVTTGPASKILVKLPGQAFTNGTGITGIPDFSSYGGDLRWAEAGTGFPITLVIVDAANNLVTSENGSRDVDFTTTAGIAPDGTNPTINGSTFPVNNLSVSFTDGESTTSITGTLYDFTESYSLVTLTASDNSGSPTLTGDASTGFWVLFAAADHIDWTNALGQVTTTPVNSTRTVALALPTFYISALDPYDNRDTTYTGSSITTTGGSVNAPTNSPSGKGQGGTSLPNGNTPPDYGTSSTWSKGTVVLLNTNGSERTILYAATATGFQIRAIATGGALNGNYTPNSDLFVVNYGALNYVRIENASGGGGTEYTTDSLSTTDVHTYWSIGYDQWCNTRGNEVAYWTSTNLTPAADSINSTYWTFNPTAPNNGDGTITADASTGTDRTITGVEVTADPSITIVKIRSAPDGGGVEVGAIEIAGADNGGAYNVTQWLYAAGYNSDLIYLSEINVDWGVTGTLTETGGSGFENADPVSSNRYTAVSSSNQTGYITATYNGSTDSTGLVSVDATRPATVQNFNITEEQTHYYVNAFWSPTSSYDDGNNASSGNVADFDIRFSASMINSEAAWDGATTVGTAGKPTFNGAWSWSIYMAGFPAGYYYYAIKTVDPQGNWSLIGAGCYTTAPDYSLPVVLSTFRATGGYGKIIVDWSTESEVDALGFQLMRDVDAGFSDPVMVASYKTEPELLCQGSAETGYDYDFVDRQDIDPEMTYYYQLVAVDVNGRAETVSSQASAEALPLPTDFSMGPNYPNPFNPATRFELKLPENSTITVSVYDAQGREVSRILDGIYLEAGIYSLTWNGTDKSGNGLPSGIYFCRLKTGSTQRIMKTLLLK